MEKKEEKENEKKDFLIKKTIFDLIAGGNLRSLIGQAKDSVGWVFWKEAPDGFIPWKD